MNSQLVFQIHLVPKSLARKRIWNKKYPICIELGRQDDFMAKAQADKETSEEKPTVEKVEASSEEPKRQPQDGAKSITQKDQVLYLFGRTGREKEEWFQRFLLASKLKSEGKKPIAVCGQKPGRSLFSHIIKILLVASSKYQLIKDSLEVAYIPEGTFGHSVC